MSMYLTQLDANPTRFPEPELALDEPNGLLAIGGDLSPARLLSAYHSGIFPWYEPHRPILWWSPDPRGVLEPARLHVGRSLRKLWRRGEFNIWINRDFNKVIEGCAAPRRTADSTWISQDMMAAYRMLHRLGHAHSVEIWQQERMVAGLYGLSLGQVFCGESMFSLIDNGAKLAMLALCHHLTTFGGELIDTQMQNPFLASMGVEEWPRSQFLERLRSLTQRPLSPGCWQTREVWYD
ncbi:leucyl/phenylalanyl-tRNA--protein transferase [Aeromonas simiae]|uniref:leucyl/phenylalanyl-tRNA--protein transferase n=1 Tax=Aeromonas simiae TaxID=218936 RepID=UPI00266B5E70|nr:leucyl/phenylalanyl-tRNA--protein transferase [Aeromonas simiae]MDO2947737.1 leucyl/phenylalanyl-tRNA--protein transferase [Aeromonas simiae]MDO2952357.1 leucyl/phenylalanyl-tRNA--protein transferase [Aeromonas simiae]MDO2954952.1 leucyl/phenylalanyl-tRNA--protein transferase [Aeromonas simiae]